MLALKKDLPIEQLEGLAQGAWEDALTWFTIQKLLIAHQKMILETQQDLKSLAELVGPKNEKDTLQNALDELKELETIVSGDFSRRGQSISSLICRAISPPSTCSPCSYSVTYPCLARHSRENRSTISLASGTHKLLKTTAEA
jgi:hypothetical protein